MAYIGRDISNLSDRVVLDSITTSATATYNLLLNSVAFVPSSAESLTVSLNGVIQKPQGSYTVSGSTIVFDSALTSSDVIDFILAERAITLTTIGSSTVDTSNLVDDAVTTAKINDGAITSAKLDSGLGLGKIGQVVVGTTESTVNTTSSSFTSTGLSAQITPSSSSSKIFVTCCFSGSKNSDPNDGDWAYFSIFRDSTNLGGANGRGITGHYNYINQSVDNHYPVSMVVLDSPSSTSQLTYTVQFAGSNTNDTIAFNNREMKTSIILMEVLA